MTTRLPALFVSHGSPMHALDAGGAGPAWEALAASLPRPRSILMVSAHWETQSPMLTGGNRLETIHDFIGCGRNAARQSPNPPHTNAAPSASPNRTPRNLPRHWQ